MTLSGWVNSLNKETETWVQIKIPFELKVKIYIETVEDEARKIG